MNLIIRWLLWPLERILLPGDSELVLLRKRVFYFVILSSTPILVANIFGFSPSSKVASVCLSCFLAFQFFSMQYSRKLTERAIEYTAYATLALIIILDFNATLGDKTRPWSLVVVVLDVLLICRTKNQAAINCIAVLTIYLLVMAVEGAFRFGLFDITFATYDYPQRFDKCNCDKPPCKSSTAIQTSVWLLTLYIDFGVTRSFAKQVLEEKEKIESSVTTTLIVAEYLGAFNLEDAEQSLGDDNLPDALRTALRTLLSNLKLYKPYLPLSCLPKSFENEEGSESTKSNSSEEEEVVTPLQPQHSTSSSFLQKTISNLSMSKKVKLPVRRAKIAALLVSIRDLEDILVYSLEEFESLHKTILEVTLKAVTGFGGMVDLSLGETIHASFNASRKCSGFAVAAANSAVACLREFGEQDCRHKTVICICKDQVVLGDIGTDTMRRFTIVGSLFSKLTHMQQFALSQTIDCLVDNDTADALQFTFTLSVVLDLLYFKVAESHSIVWQLLHKNETGNDNGGSEWMYTINKASSFGEVVNSVGLLYLKNKPIPPDKIRDLERSNHGKLLLSKLGMPITVAYYGSYLGSLVSDNI